MSKDLFYRYEILIRNTDWVLFCFRVEDGESSMLHSPGKIKRKSHSPHSNRSKEDSPLSATKPKQASSKDKNDNANQSEAEKPLQKESDQSKPSQKPALSNDLFAGKIGNIPDPKEVINVPGTARTGKVTGGQETSRVVQTSVSMAGYKKPEPVVSSSGSELISFRSGATLY